MNNLLFSDRSVGVFDISDALPVVLAIKLLFTTEFTQLSPQCLCFGYFSRQKLNFYQHYLKEHPIVAKTTGANSKL